MAVLKLFTPSDVYEHLQRGLSGATPAPPPTGRVWRLCTTIGATDSSLTRSRLFKSVKEEIDDGAKRATFVELMSALGTSSNQENYYEFFKNYTVECKEAHSFEHMGQRIKILELKRHRKKERLYFYPFLHQKMKYFVVLQALHKRDEQTPKSVKGQCATEVRELMSPATQITILG